jgi:hypothetical protein
MIVDQAKRGAYLLFSGWKNEGVQYLLGRIEPLRCYWGIEVDLLRGNRLIVLRISNADSRLKWNEHAIYISEI